MADYHVADGPAPTKRELLGALVSSRDEVVALVRSLPPQRLEEGRHENGWNGRQILAHIASIEWSYPRLIDIARTPPPPVEEAPPTRAMKGGNDAYNDRQVAKREHLTVAELLAEFEANRAATIHAVQAADEELFARRIRSAGGVVGPLASVFHQIAVAHVLGHARDILGDSAKGTAQTGPAPTPRTGDRMAERNARGPLDGVKVLDMTEHMAGPFCTMILADMGAEVIKLERPGSGDSSRGMGDGSERNPYFRYINRNKKSLTLDYKGPRGRAIFLKLVGAVDVLVENYRPTVMDRAGLGWDALQKENPRLIYAQLSGFGGDGPYREKGGFDLIAQGMGGIMHVTGEPDGPPTSVGLPICDLGTGMWGAQGVLAALYERQRTGRGQKIECSLLETAIGFSSWTSAGWLADHVEPVRMGSRHRQNAPYQRFETKDGYMMIGAAGQSIWERCARALGHPEWLEDPRFGKAAARRKHRFALEKEIIAVLATAPTAHWIKALDDAGVPCGPVYNYEQLFADPQVLHREMVVHADDAELGRVPHIRTPIRMSGGAVSVRRTAPRLGQHTDEILTGLGYTAADIADLRRERAI